MLKLIHTHSKILNECEATLPQLAPNNPREFTQMYIKFAPTYSVAAKIFHTLQGTQDPRIDFVLKDEGIVVPSKEELAKYPPFTMYFISRVYNFADEVEVVKRKINAPLNSEFNRAFSAQESKK